MPGFPGAELLYEDGRDVGVRAGDKGIDKHGQRKGNFEPGVDLRAKVTILAEGARGSLSKALIARLKLDEGKFPQVYSIGVKELWEVPKGRLAKGAVLHTMGYPLDTHTFGGGFIYGRVTNTSTGGPVTTIDSGERISLGVYGPSHPANSRIIRPLHLTTVDSDGRYSLRAAPGA